MNDTIKGLPVNELTLVAITVVLGWNPDIDEGGAVELEMDVLNVELWNKFNAKNKPNRCACCGHALKYACAVVHTPTGNGYWIGRDCARKIETLRHFDSTISQHTVALAERIACNKREADFLAANPDTMSIIAWCKLPRAPKIAKDMLEKMRRFGDLSVKQIETLERIRQQDAERRANATAKVITGRQTIRGIVLKADPRRNDVGSSPFTLKLLLDLGTGVRLYGNAPEYVDVPEQRGKKQPDYVQAGQNHWSWEVVEAGDTVEFTGTVEASQNDDLFGFWKRPAKFKIVARAA